MNITYWSSTWSSPSKTPGDNSHKQPTQDETITHDTTHRTKLSTIYTTNTNNNAHKGIQQSVLVIVQTSVSYNFDFMAWTAKVFFRVTIAQAYYFE